MKHLKKYFMLSMIVLFCGILAESEDQNVLHNQVDIAVIGSGPAGLTAGMYGSRAGYRTVVYQGPTPGGQLTNAAIVENWPGLEKMSGQEAVDKLKKQAEKFGTVIEPGVVEKVDFTSRPFKLFLQNGNAVDAHSVVIASGASPRKLGIPGEEEFWGKGVALCAVCDAPLYKNKDVVIVGGGDAAMEQVLLLAPYAKKITVLVRASKLRASHYMQEKVKDIPQLKILCNTKVVEFAGADNRVNKVTFYNFKTKKKYTIPAQGVFIAIGQDPNVQFLDNQLKLNKWGCIKTTECSQCSSIVGVFAAGNVADCFYRQAGVACGSGTKAALNARDYLQRQNIKPTLHKENIKSVEEDNHGKKKEKEMLSLNQEDVQVVQNQDLKTVQTVDELNNQLKQGERITLVYIYSPRCPHCMKMSPLVNELYQEHKNTLNLVKVDVTKGSEVASSLNIEGVPTFIIYKGTEKLDQAGGEMPKEQLEEFIKNATQGTDEPIQ